MVTPPAREVPRAPARLLPVLVAAVALTAVLSLPPPQTHDLSFAVASRGALAAALVAGLGLAAAGVVAGAGRAGTGLAVAFGIASTAWLAPELVAREDAPAWVRTLAGLVAPLFAPALLHAGLVLARWPGQPWRRRLVVAGYVVVAALTVVRFLVWSPGLDPDCWSNCTSNALLVHPAPHLASALTAAVDLSTLVVAVAAVVAGAWMVRTALREDRVRAWAAVPLVAAAVVVAAHAGMRVVRPFETPLDPDFVRLFHARAWTLAAMAAGVVVLVLLELRRRLEVQAVLTELADVARGRSLEELLRDATGDPELLVRYPLAGVDDLLDAQGRRHHRPASDGKRVVTPLVRDGREVAVVVHDPSRVGVDELRRAAGPAARLAVDNERLRAELLLRLAELRASRARLVEAGDTERRALERDLHDGAQHRLLALGHDVRRARQAAAHQDGELLTALLAAERGVQEAVADLRAVARGLYPAVLTAEGLEGALWSLSDSAPVPLEILSVPRRRYPEAVERTVYSVTAEAIEAARRGSDGADGVTADVREAGGLLVVQVAGVPGQPPVTVVDRVGALGGSVDAGPTGWHVELPCG